MGDGQFEALGYEEWTLKNPILLICLIGILQIFPVLLLDRFVVAGLYFHIPGYCFDNNYTPTCNALIDSPGWTQYSETVVPVTLLLMIASFIVLIAWRIKNRGTVSNELINYSVSYVDDRDAGGRLRISYTDPGNKKRDSLIVRKVTPHPHHPLMKQVGVGRYSTMEPVSGTESSLDIFIQRPQVALSLGFENAPAMDKVYEQLKEYNAPDLPETALKRPLGLPPHLVRHLAVAVLGFVVAAGLAAYSLLTPNSGLFPVLGGVAFTILVLPSSGLLASVLVLSRKHKHTPGSEDDT